MKIFRDQARDGWYSLSIAYITAVGALLIAIQSVRADSCSEASSLFRSSVSLSPDQRIQQYKKVLQLCPTMAEAYFNLGLAQLEVGSSQEAVDSLFQAKEKKPKDVSFIAAYATALLRAERFTEAREQYEQVLTIEPQYVKALVGLAATADRTQDLVAAEGFIDRAFQTAPRNGEVLAARAAIREKRGDIDGAIDMYQALIDEDSTQTAAIIRLVTLYIDRGETDKASRLIDRSLAADSRNAELLRLQAQILSEGNDQAKAIVALKRARDIDPKNSKTVIALAALLVGRHSHFEAREVLKSARAMMPGNAQILDLSGQAEVGLGDFERAEMFFKEALSIDALDPRIHYNYSLLLGQKGRKEEAQREREAAEKLDPEIGKER